MKTLVRFISRSATGSVEHRDKIFEGEDLSFGRATDQTIQLRDPRVGLEHARIVKRGKGFSIYTKAIGGISVNDKSCRDAPLKTGDVVRIGANILHIVDPTDDVDFAFTFELDADARADEAETTPYKMSLAETALRKRRWSWAFVLTILVVFFLVPLGMIYPNPVKDWISARSLPGWAERIPLPDDQVWDSGPLYRAHDAQIGDDCSQCHVKAFQMVGDAECLACHEGVSHHVDATTFNLPELDNRRCGSCHKEHGGPDYFVRRDQSLCADCHGDLRDHAVDAALADAADFGTDHPEFSLSILMPESQHKIDGSIDWMWEITRVAQSSDSITEQSNLKFSHKAHLVPEGVKAPDGQVVMECGDCHQLESDGLLMTAINMELHCEQCHQLTFDEQAPDRVLPHGSAESVVQTLEEFYSYRFLTGGTEAPDEARQGRRPGRTMTREEQSQAVALAEVQADATAAEIFGDRLCVNCHEIDELDQSEGRSRWQVRPVRLTRQWMTKARFDHSQHRMSDCGDCHVAAESEHAADVLMPDIDDCRSCHTGTAGGAGQLASTCIDCHGFHLERHGPMREASTAP